MRGWLAWMVILCGGCAHTVVLDSEPAGAEVELDGNLIGKTPVSFVDRASMKRSYDVVLRRDGFRTQRQVLTQTFSGTAFCCPLLIPVGWQLGEDHYTWPLARDDGAPPAIPGMLNAAP